MLIACFLGGLAIYSFIRVLARGFYTVRPDERAVLTSFGRAVRLPTDAGSGDPSLSEDEQERYDYPQL